MYSHTNVARNRTHNQTTSHDSCMPRFIILPPLLSLLEKERRKINTSTFLFVKINIIITSNLLKERDIELCRGNLIPTLLLATLMIPMIQALSLTDNSTTNLGTFKFVKNEIEPYLKLGSPFLIRRFDAS